MPSRMAVTSSVPAVAACLLVLLLDLLSQSTTAEQVLIGNSTLYAGQALYNRYRSYRFVVQRDCNVVLYEFHKPIWSSDTGRLNGPCEAVLGHSGHLQVRRIGGGGHLQETWTSRKRNAADSVHYVLVVQNDLDVVIYSVPVWSTDTGVGGGVQYQYGDQMLLAGGTLHAGEFLENENMHFRFIMQDDCNLVLYDDANLIWSSGTSGKGSGCSATLRSATGQLVIRDIDGRTLWVSSNHAPSDSEHILLLKPDRDVVVYTGPVWSTGTSIPKRTQPSSSEAEAAGN